MKPANFFNKSKTMCPFRFSLAAPIAMLTLASAHAGTTTAPAAPAEETPLTNWIGFTIGGAFGSGNNAGVMQRTQTNGYAFYGGIESLQFSQKINNSTTMTLDGHALPGLEDYEFNLNLTKADVGYVKAGYKQFRTWYDGSGGYLPGAQYGQLADDELSIDRGELSFEAGLRMENVPEITFAYKHAFRNGQKDSLTWGEGSPAATANSFKLMPALWGIDEQVDTFELNVEHTLGNTDLGIGLIYEHASYSNSRTNTKGNNMAVTSPATTNSSAFRSVTQTDNYTMDLFAGNIHSVTRFSDKLWLTAGFAYNTMDTGNNGGTRSFDYPYSVYRGSRGPDAQYKNMDGGGYVNQLIGNVNLMWVPMPDLTVTPSLRYEHEDQRTWASITSYTVDANKIPSIPTYPAYLADSEMNEITGVLDIRYTGISDMVLYAKGQWGKEDENLTRMNISAADPVIRDWMSVDNQISEQEYTLGANWYPIRGLSFSLQGLYAERDQSLDPTAYNNSAGTTGGQTLRPIMLEHDSQTSDINLRMTWRPLSNLSLVTRYDYTTTEYNNRGVNWTPGTTAGGPPAGNILDQIESGNITSNIVSESVTWSPLSRMYVQGTVSYIWSQTDTPAADTPDWNNNYLTGSLTVGYAIDDKTDITGSFTYYGTHNYVAAADSMGYGYGTQEYGASLTLTRMITPNMVWNLRYGFITSNNNPMPDQTGGYNDFAAQMVSTGLQIRF